MVQLFGYKESWAHLGPADLSVNPKGDIWDLPKPVAKLICTSGRTTHFFPQSSCCHVWKKKKKTNCESGSGRGEWPELLRGSGAYHWLVLAKRWAQKSSEEVLSLCLTVKDTCSSLAICVPKVKHVLNEARVLRLGQSWILNSSMFCSFCWKMGLIFSCFLGDFEDKLTSIHGSQNDREETHE